MKEKIYIILLSFFYVYNTYATEFYISPGGNDKNPGSIQKPFATIQEAQKTVRNLLQKGQKENITIYLRSGRYQINNTIVFGLKDSAQKDFTVTYAAYKNEKPVISSGKNITGWKKLLKHPKALPAKAHKKVWVADVPETKGYKKRFHVLYDNEDRLQRAQSKGFKPTGKHGARKYRWIETDKISYPENMIKNWPNLEDIEIRIRPTAPWLVNYLTLGSVNEKQKTAGTTIPGTYRLDKLGGRYRKDPSVWIQNVIDYLDEPGEWCLNTQEGKVYYWPESGKPGNNIFAPQLRELIRVEGKNVESIKGDVPVQGLTFKGLAFTCGDRDVWSKDSKGIQHDWEMYDTGNGLLRFRGAKNCKVIDCTFRNSGGTAIRCDLYAQNIEMTGNHIYNMGATGILLCGYGPGLKDVNKGHVIKNNHIHNIGQLFWHSLAVFIWQSGENKVLNNYIHDLPYIAIVMSGIRPRYFGILDPVKWTEEYRGVIPDDLRENKRVIRWKEVGKPKTAAETVKYAHARNNLIQDNEIHDIMELMSDGNAIYYSCGGPDNVVKRNLIYRSMRSVTEIRFDDDQQDCLAEENIVFGNGIKLKHRNKIINNVIVGRDPKIFIRPETEPGAVITKNIVYKWNPGKKTPRGLLTASTNTPLKKLYGKIEIDQNVYYSPDKKDKSFYNDFKKIGYEKNSIFADPLFENINKGDIRLKDNSKAKKIGIKSIDITKIGLLNDPAYKRLAKMKDFSEVYGKERKTAGEDYYHKY